MFVSIYDSAQVGHAILMAARTIVLSERPPRVFLVFVSLFVYEDNGDGIDGFGTLISGAGSDPVSIRLCRRRPASVLPHRIKAASRTEVYGADGRSEVMVDAAPWTSAPPDADGRQKRSLCLRTYTSGVHNCTHMCARSIVAPRSKL